MCKVKYSLSIIAGRWHAYCPRPAVSYRLLKTIARCGFVQTSNWLNEVCRGTWTFSGISTALFYDTRVYITRYTGFIVNRYLCCCVLFCTNFTVSVLCGCLYID